MAKRDCRALLAMTIKCKIYFFFVLLQISKNHTLSVKTAQNNAKKESFRLKFFNSNLIGFVNSGYWRIITLFLIGKGARLRARGGRSKKELTLSSQRAATVLYSARRKGSLVRKSRLELFRRGQRMYSRRRWVYPQTAEKLMISPLEMTTR